MKNLRITKSKSTWLIIDENNKAYAEIIKRYTSLYSCTMYNMSIFDLNISQYHSKLSLCLDSIKKLQVI